MIQTNEVALFTQELIALNGVMAELFKTGNVALIGDLNRIVKKMHAIQSGSKDPALQAIDGDCRVIYGNSDMIVAVLRTTEDGVIDRGAQTALNKFLHNIDEAVVAIASAFGIV